MGRVEVVAAATAELVEPGRSKVNAEPYLRRDCRVGIGSCSPSSLTHRNSRKDQTRERTRSPRSAHHQRGKKKWRRGDRAGEEEEEGVARSDRANPAANRRRTGGSERRLSSERRGPRAETVAPAEAGVSDEGPRTVARAGVQPGERRCSIGLAAASAHSSSGGRTGEDGETARRRADEPTSSSDMAAAPARTSCGAAEHRFGWRDATTPPAVTPAARHMARWRVTPARFRRAAARRPASCSGGDARGTTATAM
ncbi:hypothetical protein Scep_007078 [Stephania cephalantha]|uniref:Uncharacterized protein n=1 Tax=Stephania cephalantha TaxID=152367 RepID=A0AAP0K9C9_9MAGN